MMKSPGTTWPMAGWLKTYQPAWLRTDLVAGVTAAAQAQDAAPADQAAELARKLANPANPKYDEKLLSAMSQKLNLLIKDEIGEDKAMFTPPKKG